LVILDKAVIARLKKMEDHFEIIIAHYAAERLIKRNGVDSLSSLPRF